MINLVLLMISQNYNYNYNQFINYGYFREIAYSPAVSITFEFAIGIVRLEGGTLTGLEQLLWQFGCGAAWGRNGPLHRIGGMSSCSWWFSTWIWHTSLTIQLWTAALAVQHVI